MARHRADPIPRTYRRLQTDGERHVFLRFLRPKMWNWWSGPSAEPVPQTTEPDTMLLYAEFCGATAPVGPPADVNAMVARDFASARAISGAYADLQRQLAEHLRNANFVADQGEEVAFTFSVQVYVHGRIKAWPDLAPGYTSPPWVPIANGSILMRPEWADFTIAQRVLIPAVLEAMNSAYRDGAFRCAVLCEPTTAAWARAAGLGEYVEIVEDARQGRGVLRVAKEA